MGVAVDPDLKCGVCGKVGVYNPTPKIHTCKSQYMYVYMTPDPKSFPLYYTLVHIARTR